MCLGLMRVPCNSLSPGAFVWRLPLCSLKLRFPEVAALEMSPVTFPVTVTITFPVTVSSLAAGIRSGVRGSVEVRWEPGGNEGPAQSVRARVYLWGHSTGWRSWTWKLRDPRSREPLEGAGSAAPAGRVRCPKRPHGGDVRPRTAGTAGAGMERDRG
ncbi:hypothetical protein Nmel_014199, partial [Mimus melanotis]